MGAQLTWTGPTFVPAMNLELVHMRWIGDDGRLPGCNPDAGGAETRPNCTAIAVSWPLGYCYALGTHCLLALHVTTFESVQTPHDCERPIACPAPFRLAVNITIDPT